MLQLIQEQEQIPPFFHKLEGYLRDKPNSKEKKMKSKLVEENESVVFLIRREEDLDAPVRYPSRKWDKSHEDEPIEHDARFFKRLKQVAKKQLAQ